MPELLSAATAGAPRGAHAGLIRVGIIGFGKMGKIRYDTIARHGGAQVVGIAEPGPVDGLADVRRFGSPEALLEDPSVEAVFLCTPNHLNQPLTIQALRAGKHVFCEKPPAFTAAELEAAIAVERASAGLKLMYGFNHRHHDSIRHAKQLIDSGQYGRLLWMRGRYGKSVDDQFYKSWRARRESAGGGILLDQGIHMLDLFLMMGGRFDEVHAVVSNLYWKLDVEDNVFAIFRNSATGLVASLHSTMTQWRHLFALEIFLEYGYLVINGLLTPSGTYGEEAITIAKNRSCAPAATWSDEEQIRFQVNNSWRYEVEQFFDAIRRDEPVRTGTSADALTLMRLIDRIYAHGCRGDAR
jgi:predicted dehydrogenase